MVNARIRILQSHSLPVHYLCLRLPPYFPLSRIQKHHGSVFLSRSAILIIAIVQDMEEFALVAFRASATLEELADAVNTLTEVAYDGM